MEKQFIFCHTVSGEGYSNPTFKLFNTAEGARRELLNTVRGMLDGGYTYCEQKGKNDVCLGTTNDEDSDYHRLQILEVDKTTYHLIYFEEPNEVFVPYWSDMQELVKGYMANCIDMETFDKGEEPYNGEDSYGAHTDDGYKHWEIISITEEESVDGATTNEPKGTSLYQGMQKEIAIISAIASARWADELNEHTSLGSFDCIDKIAEAAVAFCEKFENELKNSKTDWDEESQKMHPDATGYEDLVILWTKDYLSKTYSITF